MPSLIFHHHMRSTRVAPEPPPQHSLREEVAIYKAKMRAVKAARIAAKPLQSINIIKPKTRAKTRSKHTLCYWTKIKTYIQALRPDFTGGFRRRTYMCMGYICCIKDDVLSFVNDEFPQHVPVV